MAVGETANPGARDACSQWRNHLLYWPYLHLHPRAGASRRSVKASTWSLLNRGHAVSATRRSLLRPSSSSSLSRFSFSVHITQVPRRGKPQSEDSRRMTSWSHQTTLFHCSIFNNQSTIFLLLWDNELLNRRIVKSFCYYHLKIGTKTSVVLNFSFIAFSIFTKILNI